MKKFLVILLGVLILTGCGNKKNNSSSGQNNNGNNSGQGTVDVEKKVIKDQIFEGLEFVNVGASDGVIKTIVINNTGYVYEGSKFKMVIMDANGNVLTEEIGEVKEAMATGTTKEIETKTSADLTNAASIEYSIISE